MKRNTFFLILVLIFFTLYSRDSRSQKIEKNDNPAYIAYELRMNGKADLALQLLEQTLKEDSTNAMALYEQTRTLLHCRNTKMERSEFWVDLKDRIEKVIELDPDNINYYPFAIVVYNRTLAHNLRTEERNGWVNDMYTLCQKMLELNPDDPKIKLELLKTCLAHQEILHCNEDVLIELVTEIKRTDEVLGAIASNMLHKDIENDYEFWKEMVNKYPANSDAFHQLAQATQDDEEGTEYYIKAVNLDRDKAGTACYLLKFLSLVIEDESDPEHWMKLAEKFTEAFLSTDTYPPAKAFVSVHMAKIYNITKNEEKGAILWNKAQTIDPFMLGFPFIPPTELFTSLSK